MTDQTPTPVTPGQVLAAPIGDGHPDGGTIRDFLCDLLAALWCKGEDFSAKRPFGDSGWQWDVYAALHRAGLVPADVDTDGEITEMDTRHADRLMLAAIRSLR